MGCARKWLRGKDLRVIARDAVSRRFKMAVSQGVSCGVISRAVERGRSAESPVVRGIELLIGDQKLYPRRRTPAGPRTSPDPDRWYPSDTKTPCRGRGSARCRRPEHLPALVLAAALTSADAPRSPGADPPSAARPNASLGRPCRALLPPPDATGNSSPASTPWPPSGDHVPPAPPVRGRTPPGLLDHSAGEL